MAERPWWRQLYGQPPIANPTWWGKSLVTRVGMIFSGIWGVNLIFRLLFPEKLGGGAWIFAGLTLASLIALLLGLAREHRQR